MKKRKIMLFSLSVFLMLCLYGCSHVKTAGELGTLQSFEYTFGAGLSDTPIYTYSIRPAEKDKENRYVVSCVNDITHSTEYSEPMDEDEVNAFSALLFSCDVNQWDGYHKDNGITDGYEWRLYAQFENGVIDASGNGVTPDNYDYAHNRLIGYLDGLLNK